MSENNSQQPIPNNELFDALAKAQGEFPVIPKDSKVDVKNKEGKLLYTYKYSDLTTIISCTRPALSKNGLSFTQGATKNELGPGFETIFMHKSGQTLKAGFIPCTIPSNADMKTVAGLVTYIKRISLTAALGISADEDFDAGANEGMNGNSTDKSDNPSKGSQPKQQNQPKQSSPQKEPLQNHAPGGLSQKQLQRMYAIGLQRSWSSEYLRLKVYLVYKKTPGELDKKQYDFLCTNFETKQFNAKDKAELDHMAQNLSPEIYEKISGKKPESNEPPPQEFPPDDAYNDGEPNYENE